MKNAEHVLVAINEEGEHEIIFVSNDIKEVNHRAMSYADECFVYSCGVKAYHEALHTTSNAPSSPRQVETLVRRTDILNALKLAIRWMPNENQDHIYNDKQFEDMLSDPQVREEYKNNIKTIRRVLCA